MVPYPAFDNASSRREDDSAAIRTDELVAFQISTNVSIRRFLNRVNSVIFDTKSQGRMTQANYVSWLLRTTQDLWAHHSALYRNVPDFLLTSIPRVQQQGSPAETLPTTPEVLQSAGLGNNPWNVVRLMGRYYAGQYIIHRPFVEYVLLNLESIPNHPHRSAILERCRSCFDGCRGFIMVFDVDPANSVTCLFAAGMV